MVAFLINNLYMKENKIMRILSTVCGNILGNEMTYKLKYFHQRKHFPNLANPKDLSEYLISKMFQKEFLIKAEYADKVLVRDYLKKKGLENLLLPHYGNWNKPEDIEWEKLPEKFILKTNNGCGNHVTCFNKSLINKNQVIDILNSSIQEGLNHIEPHYRAIKPQVFAEYLIEMPNGESPVDYKFTCINGKVCDCFIAVDRKTNVKYITLDENWKPLATTKKEYLPNYIPSRPKHLKEMIKYAEMLSADFDVVRVDFYEYNDNVYFSELTFTPWGALMYSYTDEAILELGKLLRK